MNNNVYSLENYRMSKRYEAMQIVKLLLWPASICLALGILFFLTNNGELSITNLGLMMSYSMFITSGLIFATVMVILLSISKLRSQNQGKNRNLKVDRKANDYSVLEA